MSKILWVFLMINDLKIQAIYLNNYFGTKQFTDRFSEKRKKEINK